MEGSRIVDLIAGFSGVCPEITFSDTQRKGEIADTRANIGKAEHLLGWHPEIELEAGLKALTS